MTPESSASSGSKATAAASFSPSPTGRAGTRRTAAARYLLDTVKGADLGEADGDLVLDFNFAYNPSCSYNPRWVCPLSPPENRLGIDVRAGERAEAVPGFPSDHTDSGRRSLHQV